MGYFIPALQPTRSELALAGRSGFLRSACDQIFRFGVFLGVVLIGGCTPPRATTTTSRDEAYTKEPKRLIVIETIGNELGRAHDSFKTILTQRLSDCGAVVDFVAQTPRDPLALDNSAAEAQQRNENDLIRKFSPDALLLMTQTSVTWSGGVPAYPRNIVYVLKLLDASTKKAFWSANVSLFTNFDLVDFGDPGVVLANNIMTKLLQDKVIRSCSAAAAH